MISDRNRRRIFQLCRSLGFDDETRRLIQQSATGKESLKKMSDRDAWLVIRALREEWRKVNRGGSPRRGVWKNKLPKGDNVVNLMTHEQRKKIIAMSMQIYGSFNEDAVNRLCLRQFGKPFKALTAEDAGKFIEMQKSIYNRPKKEAPHGIGTAKEERPGGLQKSPQRPE